jgi:hypothetical protein
MFLQILPILPTQWLSLLLLGRVNTLQISLKSGTRFGGVGKKCEI